MNDYYYEENFLSKYASKASCTKGRSTEETPCPFRNDYQRDRDRIIHCKAFRRLKHKTQVFLSPQGDHYRTRLTHTLEVSQIARTIARSLRLNEDLAEAIALGHDLGHTPFGHAGESVLNRLNPNGFKHNEQSLRIVDLLANDGKGLNLTYEVKDGLVNHRINGNASTLEGKIVAYTDRIAYLNHDIEDAITAGLLKEDDIPERISRIAGCTKSDRIRYFVSDIITNCREQSFVNLTAEAEEVLAELRAFMFSEVYDNPIAKSEDSKSDKLITSLYQFYSDNPNMLPDFYQLIKEQDCLDNAITDYIASMTDRYAISAFTDIFIPRKWHIN